MPWIELVLNSEGLLNGMQTVTWGVAMTPLTRYPTMMVECKCVAVDK